MCRAHWPCLDWQEPDYYKLSRPHLDIDARTLEIQAIEVTDNSVGDAPMLLELLSQISAEEALLSVRTNGAYDTQDCDDAIATRGAQAVISTRKNAQLWKAKRLGAAARNETLRATNRLGKLIWMRWSGYHWHSLVEPRGHFLKPASAAGLPQQQRLCR